MTPDTSGDKVEIYRSLLSRPSQRWRWRRVAANGERLSQSSEGYSDPTWAASVALRCNGPDVVIEFPVDKK